MLPASGVTKREPFTHPTLDKASLRRTLYWLVRRAYGRVRPDDVAAVDAGLADSQRYNTLVRGAALPDFASPNTGTDLDSVIGFFESTVPYVVQPGARQNQPPEAPGDAVLLTMRQEAVPVLRAVAAGNANATIRQVFQLPNDDQLARIRGMFTAAADGLERLHANRAILVDSRGDLASQGAGALSSPRQMLLPPSFFAARTDDRVRTLLHECFHVADAAIVDHVYFGNAGFDALLLAEKLVNAEHYGEVARRHAHLDVAPPGPITVQAGASVALTLAQITKVRDGATDAAQRLTRAWVRTLWTWQRMRAYRVYQESWNPFAIAPDELVALELIRDSETCGMTLHRPPGGRCIAPIGKGEPLPMITDYDQAVLEEIIADTHRLVGWSQALRTIDVIAAGPAAGTQLVAADVAASPSEGLADSLVDLAIASLPNRFPTPATLKEVVNSLRIRDSHGQPH
jgi:hypothetical protein